MLGFASCVASTVGMFILNHELHVAYLPTPVWSRVPGAAQIWCSERVRHSPYTVTAFVQGVPLGVVVHVHAEVSVCVVSRVEVRDHPGGNPQTPQHCK